MIRTKMIYSGMACWSKPEMAIFRFEFGNLVNKLSFLGWKLGYSTQHFISSFQFKIRLGYCVLYQLGAVLVSYYWKIWIQFWPVFTRQPFKLLRLETWVRTRQNFQVSNPEFQTWKRHFLVYFNKPRIPNHTQIPLFIHFLKIYRENILSNYYI